MWWGFNKIALLKQSIASAKRFCSFNTLPKLL
jgi:hypothetical protein